MNLARALPKRPSTLFVCADPFSFQRTDRFGMDMAEAFAEAGLEFGDLAVLDGRNADQAQMLIWQSDLIILSGGHVPTQNAFFRKLGLAELIKDFQGVVLGISAGSMNSAGRVYAQPEMAGESVPEFPRFLPGLGLTRVNILPHYQQVKDDILDGLRLFEDVTYADSMGECFFALVDGSYILEAGGQTLLFGEAYCIRDGGLEQICRPGDWITL